MKYDEIFDYSEYSVAANYRDYVSDPNSFLPYCTWPGVKLYNGIANYDFAVLVKDHDCFFPVIIYEEGQELPSMYQTYLERNIDGTKYCFATIKYAFFLDKNGTIQNDPDGVYITSTVTKGKGIRALSGVFTDKEMLFMTSDEKPFTISDLVNGVFSSYSAKTYSSKEF